MTTRIQWSANIAVSNGPTLSLSKSLDVEAYDVITASIPGSGASTVVELVPGISDHVKFVAVTADRYDSNVKYTVNSDATELVLDQPHLFPGEGGVTSLSGNVEPETLTFTNDLSEDVTIQVLVGRDATPPSP